MSFRGVGNVSRACRLNRKDPIFMLGYHWVKSFASLDIRQDFQTCCATSGKASMPLTE
jgi:hypothetical protein